VNKFNLPKNTLSKTKPKAEKLRESYDPRKHGISQTNLSIFLECREKNRLRYINGLSPIDVKRAFMQGNHYHDSLEYIYKMIKVADLTKKDKPDIQGNIAPFLEKKEAELTKLGRQTNLDDQMETLDFAHVLIPAYFNRWKEDFTRNWVYVEDKFSIPVFLPKYKIAVNFKGKFDQGFDTPKGFWLMETKFKTRWSESISDFLQLDLQTCSYVAAAKMMGHDLKGCIYNIIRKPQLKRKKAESRKDFIYRVDADIADRKDFYFERHKVEFGKAELEANLRRLTALITSYLDWYLTDHTDRDLNFNSGACENMYGTCEYLPLCARGDTASFKKYGDLRD
jgi:hypothetical protein